MAEDEDPETGEPIAQIEDLEEEPATDFLSRIRGRIHRRALGHQALELIWKAPAAVLFEWIAMLMEALGRLGPSRRETGDE